MTTLPKLPAPNVPLVDPATGLVPPVWYQYLLDLNRVLTAFNTTLTADTGWGSVTGSLDKSTFATGTVTLTPLAQQVGSIKLLLIQKGLIGP